MKTVFVLMLSLFFFVGCNSINIDMPLPQTQNGLELKSFSVVTLMGHFYGVNGVAINRTGKNLGLCNVTFELLDDQGMRVGEAVAMTQNLKPDQGWKFTAYASSSAVGESISKIEITSVKTDWSMLKDYQVLSQEMLKNNPNPNFNNKRVGIFISSDGSVVSVAPNSSAEKEGVLSGDKILKIGNVDVSNSSSQGIITLLSSHHEEGSVELSVLRDNNILDFILTFQ